MLSPCVVAPEKDGTSHAGPPQRASSTGPGSSAVQTRRLAMRPLAGRPWPAAATHWPLGPGRCRRYRAVVKTLSSFSFPFPPPLSNPKTGGVSRGLGSVHAAFVSCVVGFRVVGIQSEHRPFRPGGCYRPLSSARPQMPSWLVTGREPVTGWAITVVKLGRVTSDLHWSSFCPSPSFRFLFLSRSLSLPREIVHEAPGDTEHQLRALVDAGEVSRRVAGYKGGKWMTTRQASELCVQREI